jgi:hypothetical protein
VAVKAWGVSMSLAMALAACSGNEEPPAIAEGKEHIACALGGEQKLAKVCAVERAKGNDGMALIVRHPDGGFRRFVSDTNGTAIAIAAADGAEQTVALDKGDRILVTVGQDRYLFPLGKMNDADKP